MFHYFGYGSNMDLIAIRAKGVEPLGSHRGRLDDWRLSFSVTHPFRFEGGMGNIVPAPGECVRGVVHACEDDALAALDLTEGYGTVYERVEVPVQTDAGVLTAWAYVGLPAYTDESWLPSQRYLNILVAGAVSAGLGEAYIEQLRRHPIHAEPPAPPFQHPDGSTRTFDEQSLAEHPPLTALAGAVFDMTNAPPEFEYHKRLFGGRDTTLYHLKRLDSSDGSETIDDVREQRLTPGQIAYLDQYLRAYDEAYEYVGRFIY